MGLASGESKKILEGKRMRRWGELYSKLPWADHMPILKVTASVQTVSVSRFHTRPMVVISLLLLTPGHSTKPHGSPNPATLLRRVPLLHVPQITQLVGARTLTDKLEYEGNHLAGCPVHPLFCICALLAPVSRQLCLSLRFGWLPSGHTLFS